MRFYTILLAVGIYLPMTKSQTPDVEQLRSQLINQVSDFNVRLNKLDTKIDQVSKYNSNNVAQLESDMRSTIKALNARIRELEKHMAHLEGTTPRPIQPPQAAGGSASEAGVGSPIEAGEGMP